MKDRVVLMASVMVAHSVVAAHNFGVPFGFGLLDTSTNAVFEGVALSGTVYKYGGGNLLLNDPRAASAVVVADTGSVQVVTSGSGSGDVSLGGIRLGALASLELNVSSGDSFSIESVRLAHVAEKTGEGTLNEGFDVTGAGMVVRGGAIEMAGHLREDVPLAAPGGCELDVSEDGTNGIVICRQIESSGVMRKAGSGVMTLCQVPGDVECVEVADGLLRLQPGIVSVVNGGETVVVANASFESGPRPGNSAYNTSVPGSWSADVKLEGHNGTVGVTLVGSPWVSASGSMIPDGELAAFVQSDARLRQSVNLPKRGRYRVSVWMANRYDGTNPHQVEIALGGYVLTNVVSRLAAPALIVAETPLLEAGDAVLSFTGKYSAGSTPSTVIDDVKMTLVESVPNGNAVASPAPDLLDERDFEDAYDDIGSQQWISIGPGNRRVIGGWNFESREDKDNCGPNVNKINPTAAKGKVNAMIQNMASISREIELPLRGVYRVTFLSAARSGYEGHHFRVKWNGVPLGMVETSSVAYRECSFQIVAACDNDRGLLSFDGEGGASKSCSSVIDCVQVRRLPEYSLATSPVLKDDMSVVLASGACIDLAFVGTNTVRSFCIAGRSYTGVIRSSRFPGQVSGRGCLFVRQKGMVVFFR